VRKGSLLQIASLFFASTMFRTVLAAACVAAASAFAPMTALPRTGARGNTLSYNFSTHTVHFSILSADACFQRSPADMGNRKGRLLRGRVHGYSADSKAKGLLWALGCRAGALLLKFSLHPRVRCTVESQIVIVRQHSAWWILLGPQSALLCALRPHHSLLAWAAHTRYVFQCGHLLWACPAGA
jgi:hypothetical protein